MKLTHRHSPPSRNGYSEYRQCARWDFGFSCAFCLVHESDILLFSESLEELKRETIEHKILQSDDRDASYQYTNCFYACFWCNRVDRWKTPLVRESDNATLLDPVSTPWASVYSRSGSRLTLIATESIDAVYTDKTYNPNNPKKVFFRKTRDDYIQSHTEQIKACALSISENLNCLRMAIPESARLSLKRSNKALLKQIRIHFDLLVKIAPIPSDQNKNDCICRPQAHQTLPSFLESQCKDYSLTDFLRQIRSKWPA